MEYLTFSLLLFLKIYICFWEGKENTNKTPPQLAGAARPPRRELAGPPLARRASEARRRRKPRPMAPAGAAGRSGAASPPGACGSGNSWPPSGPFRSRRPAGGLRLRKFPASVWAVPEPPARGGPAAPPSVGARSDPRRLHQSPPPTPPQEGEGAGGPVPDRRARYPIRRRLVNRRPLPLAAVMSALRGRTRRPRGRPAGHPKLQTPPPWRLAGGGVLRVPAVAGRSCLPATFLPILTVVSHLPF